MSATEVRVFRHPERSLWAVRGSGWSGWWGHITLLDARMKVDEARRQRALAGECPRFGHAWAAGTPAATVPEREYVRANYHMSQGFFHVEPCGCVLRKAPVVVFNQKGMWVPPCLSRGRPCPASATDV